jgi:hypothetical protein
MAAHPTFDITITIAPDDPNITQKELEAWAETIVRGIGAVVRVKIERNGYTFGGEPPTAGTR